MAPGRRKGSGRGAAAAAAAAGKQWKVGDLVLAKMKGFPAWPAMISEPEKWGYSSDRKKLLVYFFGTKQIAFCNHADLEAFTEEKKKSLQVKRQGKGADFVRAVDEIVDSYEKSKKQKHDDEFKSGGECILPNAGNLEASSGKSWIKSPKGISQTTHNNQSDTLYGSIQSSYMSDPEEISVASMEDDALHNTDTLPEQPIDKVSILYQLRQTPLASITSLRKRPRDVSLQTCVIKKRAPSLRRSRSSRVDPCKIQKPEMLGETDQADSNLIPVVQDKSAFRNKLTKQSPDNSVFDKKDSLVSGALVSSGCCEDTGSEIVEMESEAIPFSEGSVLESSCKVENLMTEYLEKSVEINGRLDLQVKTAVLKKKRKPNKKRVTHGTTVHARLETDRVLQDEQSKIPSISPNSCKQSDKRFHNTDGDEHLPLVKRARARMGKSPVEENQLDTLVGTGEKTGKEVLINQAHKHCTSFDFGDNCPADGTSPVASEAVNRSSPSNDCTQIKGSDHMPWKVKSYRLNGCSVDVEAALPPSKRLHRALEAMSANAAEARNDCTEISRAAEMLSNGFMDSPKMDSCHLSTDSNTRSPRELHNMQSSDDIVVTNSSSELSMSLSSQIPEGPTEVKPGVSHQKKLRSSAECKETFMDVDRCDGSSVSKTVEIEIQVKSPELCCNNSSEKQVSATTSQSTLDQSSSPVTKKIKEEVWQLDKEDAKFQADKLEGEAGTMEPNVQKFDSVLKTKEAGSVLPLNGTGVILSETNGGSVESSVSGTTRSLISLSNENDEAAGVRKMQEISIEVQQRLTQKDFCFSPDSTPMKVLIAAAQAKRLLSRSVSLSDSIVDGKLVPDAVSSPSQIYREDSSDKVSPHKPVTHHIPYLDGKTDIFHASSRSPDVNLQQKNSMHLADMDEVRFDLVSAHKQKSLNRLTDHDTARKSFEAMLYTLSRTKESIGRATRLAIDCAKYGIADEVIEIILQNLERESSLHRRVDLFFLVDSIIQCSRGQKGVAGDVYPSLVQSVLPRLLSAAAPPGNAAWENRRQCLKVLRLWLERKTLPESIVRNHIRELDSVNEASFTGCFSRRPSRTERALNDPVREMEGMLVDEYGSNASFRLLGFLDSRVIEDEEEGNAAHEKSFEAVTPERDAEIQSDRETTLTSATEKHRHILEDVDGELEMEDVAPTCEVEMSSTAHASHHQFHQPFSFPFAPPLPEEKPPSPPPLPSSPPPMAPPCPSISSVLPHLSDASHTLSDAVDSNLYRGAHNIQSSLPQSIGPRPNTPTINLASSDTLSYPAPGYRDLPNQMPPPVASLSSSASYGNISGSLPLVRTGIRPLSSAPLSNKAYHLRPPPPTVSNQFSYVQAESQQQMQSWGDCSSSPFTKQFQFTHDFPSVNFYGDRGTRGPVQHGIPERCRFSAAVHSGPVLAEKVEVSPNSLSYYGPPSEPSPVLSHGWSFPPKASSYQYPAPASRPPLENPVSRVAGAPGYWRPR